MNSKSKIQKYEDFVDKYLVVGGNSNLAEVSLGLAGETGEVVEHIKKYYRGPNKINKEALTLELGDLLFYLVGVAHYFDITLEDVAYNNVKKLTKRHKKKSEGAASELTL